MREVLELEYRGLNLLDEISTVEIAIDSLHKEIHIYDTNQVVEPEYNFSTKAYQMSEGFFKMAKVFFDKRYIAIQSQTTTQQWIQEITWVFYGSKKSILKLEGGTIIEISKVEALNEAVKLAHRLYSKYLLRVV